MAEEYITRAKHNTFKEALNAENERQNHHLAKLEDTNEKINELAVSAQRLQSLKEVQPNERTYNIHGLCQEQSVLQGKN